MQTYRRTGLGQIIELGDLVRVRNDGRVGLVTQVTRTHVFVRFGDDRKHAYLFRDAVDSVKWLSAQAEVNEDDEHETDYDVWAATAYAAR